MPTPEPVAALRGLESYAVPAPGAPTDLRLDGNEGCPPHEAVLEQLVQGGVERLRRYPDAGALCATIAERFGLDPAGVLVTAGADEALDRVCRAYLERGRSIVLPEPGFEMLEKYARLQGARPRPYLWLAPEFPLDLVRAELEQKPAVLAVVSPNNPTGLAIDERTFRAVAAEASDSILLVDLAYAEFARFDPLRVALEYENAIVVRSLSKSWGIAGLRTGFACARPKHIAALRVAGSPYSVAGPSLALAEAWLRCGEDAVHASVGGVLARRARIEELLRARGAEVWPSQANFVFARFRDAARVHQRLARHGIAVRAFPGRPHIADCLRITCPTGEGDMQRLLGALDEVLARQEG